LLGPRFRRQARAFGAPPCGIGLDRSARPSKSGDRAANALHCNAPVINQRTLLSDNVRQVECWFSHLNAAQTSVKTTFTPQPAGPRPGLAQPRVRRGSPKGGCPGGVSGTLTMPGRALTRRASGKPGLASGLPLGREFRIADLALSHEKSPTRLRADRLGQADSPIQDSQALAPIFA
jgi:hypothetical protein